MRGLEVIVGYGVANISVVDFGLVSKEWSRSGGISSELVGGVVFSLKIEGFFYICVMLLCGNLSLVLLNFRFVFDRSCKFEFLFGFF